MYSTELTNSAEGFSRHHLSHGCRAVPGHVAGLRFGLLYSRNEFMYSIAGQGDVGESYSVMRGSA